MLKKKINTFFYIFLKNTDKILRHDNFEKLMLIWFKQQQWEETLVKSVLSLCDPSAWFTRFKDCKGILGTGVRLQYRMMLGYKESDSTFGRGQSWPPKPRTHTTQCCRLESTTLFRNSVRPDGFLMLKSFH